MRGVDRVIDVPASGFVTVPLPADTLDVDVPADGQGVVARLERPVLRSWTRPPPPQESPVGIEVVWPEKARAGSTGMLVVTLRHGFTTGVVTVDVQIPLPPGITLAATTSGASQVQGVLALRQQVSPDGLTTEIPLRCVATAPARVLSVR